MESKILPQRKFESVEEELAYLRRRVSEHEKNYSEAGVKSKEEKPAREIIAEYKKIAPKEVLYENFQTGKEEIEKIVLNLEPEEHDKKVEELVKLAKEKGVKNALEVVEKMANFHLTDDLHRYLAEYIKEGHVISGVGTKDKLSKGLNLALYEITIHEESADQNKPLREIISSMEQFYAGLLSVSDKQSGDNFVSMEIANANHSSEAVFYVAVPVSKKNLFEKHILSIFHNAKISPAPDDYNIFNESGATVGSVAQFKRSPALPLKTYEQFDHDPLNVILTAFSKVNREGEGGAIQLLWSPAGETYSGKYKYALEKIQKGVPAKEALDLPESIGGVLFKELKGVFKDDKGKLKEEEKKPIDETVVAEIKKKLESPIAVCNLRLLASSASEKEAVEILESLESSFNQFQNMAGNEIKWKRLSGGRLKKLARNFAFRIFEPEEKMPINLREMTSLIHFHTGALKKVQVLRQLRGASSGAPFDLPQDGITLGINRHRGSETTARIADEDRLRHFYCVGQTGTGKSALLKNMIIQDIKRGAGVCMIDPHGFDVQDVLANVPPERFEDVIYFDPAHTARPMALNMLEFDPRFPEQKTFVVNELFSIFKKLYGNIPESMGPAFEQYFRNSALLVMEDPESGSTLIDVSRVLSDKKYRDYKITKCQNPLITQFWQNAEKTSGEQGLANYVQYVTNKFDVFLANEIMRPVIAQEKSSFNFRDIMDSRKILLVNLSKGRLEDINAHLIGLILVAKILMAALSRSDSLSQETPPFYLYIDEFQNITTDSIATILSEARKYKLSLHIAHQYIAQLEEGIRDAVFGNVGAICSFRVGAEDAEFLEKQFAPVFTAADLMNIDNRNAYLKMLVNGKPAAPFNIATLAPEKGDPSILESLKEISYLRFGRERAEVEKMIKGKYGISS